VTPEPPPTLGFFLEPEESADVGALGGGEDPGVEDCWLEACWLEACRLGRERREEEEQPSRISLPCFEFGGLVVMGHSNVYILYQDRRQGGAREGSSPRESRVRSEKRSRVRSREIEEIRNFVLRSTFAIASPMSGSLGDVQDKNI
jgi:hypothetical protein